MPPPGANAEADSVYVLPDAGAVAANVDPNADADLISAAVVAGDLGAKAEADSVDALPEAGAVAANVDANADAAADAVPGFAEVGAVAEAGERHPRRMRGTALP